MLKQRAYGRRHGRDHFFSHAVQIGAVLTQGEIFLRHVRIADSNVSEVPCSLDFGFPGSIMFVV